MAYMMQLLALITGINTLLIASLLFVYIRNFKKTPSMFTSGLLIFAALFLIQNIVMFYFGITMMPYLQQGLQVFGLIIALIQMAAFIVLNIITFKY